MLGVRVAILAEQRLELDEIKNRLLEEAQVLREKIESPKNQKMAFAKLMEGIKIIVRHEEEKRRYGRW